MTIGDKLLALRTENNLSLRALAQRVGCSHGFLCDIEKGRRTPSVKSLRALAEVFDVSPAHFLQEADANGVQG